MEKVQLIPREFSGFPTARFLNKQEQSQYEEACEQFLNEKARDNLKIGLKGSNLFKVLLLNQIGLRTATIPELELAMENGMDLNGTYQDGSEVVLRSKTDSHESNNFLIKNLTKKLGIKGRVTKPLIIRGLGVIENLESSYGLDFEPNEDTKIIEAPDFSHKNYQRNFSRINPDYSIEFDNNSSRTLYTKDNGLSGFFLDGDSDLDTVADYFAISDSNGRVVRVDAEGVVPEFR